MVSLLPNLLIYLILIISTLIKILQKIHQTILKEVNKVAKDLSILEDFHKEEIIKQEDILLMEASNQDSKADLSQVFILLMVDINQDTLEVIKEAILNMEDIPRIKDILKEVHNKVAFPLMGDILNNKEGTLKETKDLIINKDKVFQISKHQLINLKMLKSL